VGLGLKIMVFFTLFNETGADSRVVFFFIF